MEFSLWVMLLLTIKHFLVDFTRLQTPYMYKNKGIYGHPGGGLHALLHALGSLPVFWWAGSKVQWTGSFDLTQYEIIPYVLLIEFVSHYHMDWLKVWVGERNLYFKRARSALIILHPKYFLWIGIDQTVHFLTYIFMIYFWMNA